MKTKGYFVTIKSFPHFQEHGAIIKVESGIMTVILMDCKHGNKEVTITRADI